MGDDKQDRVHTWCHGVDGCEINLYDPDPVIFTVPRIAAALARINRFAGHWEHPVSVARHSVKVAQMLRDEGASVEMQLQGLFHDAAEAFTTDIPTPLKDLLTVRTADGPVNYRVFEDWLLSRIFIALGIQWPLCEAVHRVDRDLTQAEIEWVCGTCHKLYFSKPVEPDVVAAVFRAVANGLFDERSHSNGVPRGSGND